ncbi:M48 family metallopeptidase [Sulfurisphaera javensis]|uniref:M48 family metallopeptidase n=1 Tax=Sulfurisphaera javensis TaxID=2049879 RepID=UPI0034E8B104
MKVLLDDSTDINAYIIGNNLVITKGFLTLNKDEQKAILAHELAHVTLNHYNKLRSIIIISLGVSFLLFQFNIFISLIALIFAFLLQNYISKKQEIEADRLAYRVVGDLLKNVIYKYGDNEIGLFSTHPNADVRIKMLATT